MLTCVRQAVESCSVILKPRLILASNSPRRRQLLALSDWEFDVKVTDVDESQRLNESPADYVLRLAETKAYSIPVHADQIVLAADTTVVDGQDILGKPKDDAEAFVMLARLRGHRHQVYTGVALLRQKDGLLLKELSITDVLMRDYSEEEIHAYIQTGDPLDKAGAYAIQHPSFQPVTNLEGCYTSVMGLPICYVVRMMRKMDFLIHVAVPEQCHTMMEYQCPVLNGMIRS
jgi:septum formation protein